MARRSGRHLIAFVRLPAHMRSLLVESLLLVLFVRMALTLLPFQRVRRMLTLSMRTPGPEEPDPTARSERICWAVAAAAQYVPAATCLTQALAAQVLLTRAGVQCRSYIGVRRDAAGIFAAHAWVACGDRVVVGARGHEEFTPLCAWTGDRWQGLPHR